MIIFDTETTGLIAPEAAPIEQQPHMIEFAAIKIHPRTLKEQDRINFLVNPRVPILAEVVKITGISDELVKGLPPFVAHFSTLCDFFGGQRCAVAHNLAFDVSVLYYELKRIAQVTAFPWPPVQICSVELTVPMKGYRMKLAEMFKELTGKDHSEAHRAMADVEALTESVRALRKRGMI